MADQQPQGFVPDGFVPDTAAPRRPVSAEDFMDQPKPQTFLNAASNFLTNFAHNVDPRPALKLVYDAVQASPAGNSDMQPFFDDLKGILGTHAEQFKKGYQAYKDGRISEAVGHTIAGALPLVGPQAAAIGEQAGSGDLSGALGSLAGMAAPVVGGKVLPKLSPASIGARGVSPIADASVAWGRAEGVPLDAATATGSPVIATVQKRVSDTMGGAGVAERFKAEQARGLATVGERVAAKVSPAGPQTAESAGRGAMAAVKAKIADYAQQADVSYGKLRTLLAAHPDVTVNLAPIKAVIEPIYRRIAIGGDIAPLQGGKADAARAMARILEGPDTAGISEADSALSDLKAMARDEIPTAKFQVQQVEQAVQDAMRKVGPAAVNALREGRAATTAKYAAKEVQQFLNGAADEPVQAFGRTTARADTNIARIRELAKLIPDEMPKIGRAWLEERLTQATSNGGFEHADRLAADWSKLGPETKQLIFKDPAYVQDLDHFFRLAKTIAKNPNPSGTARVMNIFNTTSTTVGYPIAKLLYSPRGVKLLTEGFRIPLRSPVAVANYTSRLATALRAAGQPSMAQQQQPDDVYLTLK